MENLPDELITLILDNLSVHDVNQFIRASKYSGSTIVDDPNFWLTNIHQRFGVSFTLSEALKRFTQLWEQGVLINANVMLAVVNEKGKEIVSPLGKLIIYPQDTIGHLVKSLKEKFGHYFHIRLAELQEPDLYEFEDRYLSTTRIFHFPKIRERESNTGILVFDPQLTHYFPNLYLFDIDRKIGFWILHQLRDLPPPPYLEIIVKEVELTDQEIAILDEYFLNPIHN